MAKNCFTILCWFPFAPEWKSFLQSHLSASSQSTRLGSLCFIAASHDFTHACVLGHFSCVQLCATLWTIVCQAPLFMGFSRHEYWSGLPCPPPGDLPHSGIEPAFLTSFALAGGFSTTTPPGKSTHDRAYLSMQLSQFAPPSPFPTVSPSSLLGSLVPFL